MIVDTYSGAPVSVQAVIDIPEGGSTVSFQCMRIGTATNMTNFDTFISALKIGFVNP